MQSAPASALRTHPQEALLAVLEDASTDPDGLAARLRAPDVAAIISDLAVSLAQRAGMPRWVDPRDPAQDALVRVYSAAIDPTREPRQQLLYLLTLIKGAVVDFERRSGDRIRSTRRSGRTSSRLERMVAASYVRPAHSSEEIVLASFDSRAVAAAVRAAAGRHPECTLCGTVADALRLGRHLGAPTAVLFMHLHLLAEVAPLRAATAA